jgi:signal transduction histidine kinase
VIVIQRRLFWKIYLTLLASLAAVILLMGGLMWFVGPPPSGGDFRGPGDGMGTEVSVYRGDGTLIASQGAPIPPGGDDRDARPEHWRTTRLALPDGGVVLARLRPPNIPRWGIVVVMLVVAGGVGLAAFPVTARLTRKLESLRAGMTRWGDGDLSVRVDETGSDEVALVARSFNAAAARVDALLTSQRALLANASHELRSPVARLRIAIELWLREPAEAMQAEIVRNLGEIDQLVEEILLSSRLEHPGSASSGSETVDLLGLAAEEAARSGAAAAGDSVEIVGDPRLLRRLIRNLLENAAKHGKPPVEIAVSLQDGAARITVTDHGPGIAPGERERVFEPFYRPAGRSESAGGWGLGLALVRQIASLHGGRVVCGEPAGGGSRFVVDLPIPPGDRLESAPESAKT